MKNKTPTELIAALLLVLISLAACGEQEGVQKQHAVSLESIDPTAQEIVFWYQHVRAREEALQEMAADGAFGFHLDNNRPYYTGRQSMSTDGHYFVYLLLSVAAA